MEGCYACTAQAGASNISSFFAVLLHLPHRELNEGSIPGGLTLRCRRRWKSERWHRVTQRWTPGWHWTPQTAQRTRCAPISPWPQSLPAEFGPPRGSASCPPGTSTKFELRIQNFKKFSIVTSNFEDMRFSGSVRFDCSELPSELDGIACPCFGPTRMNSPVQLK